MTTAWITLEQGEAAVRPALVGHADGPASPGVIAPLVAASAGPAFAALAAIADPSELEHLRHVALRLDLRRPARPGERLRVVTIEGARGPLGAAPGVTLVSRMDTEDGEEVAVSEGWAQLGPSASTPDGARPLTAPRAVRVDAPDVVLDDEVPDEAVVSWLSHTGDDVPIHRADHALYAELGGVAVPGALLAVRVVHRVEALLASVPTGLEVRFKRLVPSATPLRYLVDGVDTSTVRVTVVDADGSPLAGVRLFGAT